MSKLEPLVSCARGELPADLVLRNGRIVNVLSGEILSGDVALLGSKIAGVGSYDGIEELDVDGAYLAPGLIDAHLHVESSLVPPAEFARAVLPHGTTTVISDPHEIANVLGLEGIRFMLEQARRTPLEILIMVPSCVPATAMETNGAHLNAEELAPLLAEPEVLGLGEVMNFPGVIAGDPQVLAKLDLFAGRAVDGHAPGLSGTALAAYAAAGIGSDHESTTVEEAREKLRLGMTVFLREATAARNLVDLLPLVDERNHHRLCLCTDDRQPADLLDEGHIDSLVRTVIAHGIDPIVALRLATCNPAHHYGLRDRGAIAPGRRADLVVFDDLSDPRPRLVLCGGRVVARDGEMLEGRAELGADALPGTMHVDLEHLRLEVPVAGDLLRVIGAVSGQLVTRSLREQPSVREGLAVADPARDLAKIAVVERHRRSGNVGLGFVRGLGLERGAIATSVAHDHHNIVAAGVDDRSMTAAIRRVAELGGGMVAAEGDRVLEELPLPLAGLMSEQPIDVVRHSLDRTLRAARSLGSPLHDPFMTLSFLALEVIPSLKITDRGLIDVDAFAPVDLWV